MSTGWWSFRLDLRWLLVGAAALVARIDGVSAQGGGQAPASAPAGRAKAAAVVTPPTQDYLVYVGSEGDDHIALIRFGPSGARIERQFRMGFNPTELVGPHGLFVSPDRRYYYVSTAHGTPVGSLWKYTTGGDSLVGRVPLGLFPATVQVTPDGAYAFVVNFNLYGDMVPSSVSVVYTDAMVEIARIPTCTMPHGSRLNAQGTRHYSGCMMDDLLVEIDARRMAVARWFSVATGKEGSVAGPPAHALVAGMVGHGDMSHAAPASVTCSPTWAQPSVDGSKVYVACNKANTILEVDVATWTLGRRLPAGEGVYNLAATHDGRLLVGTNKRGQSISVIDLVSGRERARIPTTRKVASGVVVSPDDRYAFVSDEGVGSEPGTVDVFDLQALIKVASVDVGQQAGGIDVWKTVPVH